MKLEAFNPAARRSALRVLEANPYHDADGKFTTKGGSVAVRVPQDPKRHTRPMSNGTRRPTGARKGYSQPQFGPARSSLLHRLAAEEFGRAARSRRQGSVDGQDYAVARGREYSHAAKKGRGLLYDWGHERNMRG